MVKLNPHALLSSFAMGLALLFTGISVYALVDRYLDDRVLRESLAGQIISKPGTGLFIEEMNSWVYAQRGFRKNDHYFLWKGLGPTPRQVFEYGGDCADKSRLLSHLLHLNDVDSSLVTLFGCAGCGPTHVVVEARYQHGWMVADPVFDLVFPDDEFTYHGVDDLRRNPEILPRRLAELRQTPGRSAKIVHYRRERETYDHARHLNWEKFPWSRAVAAGLRRIGIDPERLRRPQLLEDPQLLVGITFAAAAGLSGALYQLLRRRAAAQGVGKATARKPQAKEIASFAEEHSTHS